MPAIWQRVKKARKSAGKSSLLLHLRALLWGETPEDRLRETGLRFCGQTVKKVKIQAAATLIAEAGRAGVVSIALAFVIH